MIHQKIIDDQLFVGSYRHLSDRGRYNKVEKLENPAAPASNCQIYHKNCLQTIQAMT
jgi:hypothetical protein